MKWWEFCWSGRGRQRKQREESITRTTEAGMQRLSQVLTRNESAAADVKVAVQQRTSQAELLRRVLNEVCSNAASHKPASNRNRR